MEEPVLRIMERTTDAGAVVLTLQGEIDIATVEALRARLADSCERDVTVDLRRVEFIDCLGLRLLLEQHRRSTARGRRIDFVQGPPAVRRVFELTGTLERLSFVEPLTRRLASAG
ncbi:MAG: STAS domain-containing protein [Solirubrobacteraceae bacterium]